jgi:hypothetical protein
MPLLVFTRMLLTYLVHFHALISLTHTYTVHTTILALCYSEIFQPSKRPSIGSTTDQFSQQHQQNVHQM